MFLFVSGGFWLCSLFSWSVGMSIVSFFYFLFLLFGLDDIFFLLVNGSFLFSFIYLVLLTIWEFCEVAMVHKFPGLF